MGVGSFLEKKLLGTPEERERKRRMNEALKREAEQARWEGKRKGVIAREKEKGFKEGKAGGKLNLALDNIANIGAGINESNMLGNPFALGPQKKQRRTSPKKSSKVTTIKVDGTTITVRNRQKNRQPRKKREDDFIF